METFSEKSVSTALDIIENSCSKPVLTRYAIELGVNTEGAYSKKDVGNAILQRLFPVANVFEQKDETLEAMKHDIVMDAVHAISDRTDEKLISKFKRRLCYDGFSVIKNEQDDAFSIVRFFPASTVCNAYSDIKDEVSLLLEKFEMKTALGHLKQALENYDNGNWAASNSQLRAFFESVLNDIAVSFGCALERSAKEKRDFLGQMEQPFLLPSLNEWHTSSQQPQFIQGLISRLHPEGSHPGLSDENDCCFRIQIVLITTRLLLQRFDAMRQNTAG